MNEYVVTQTSREKILDIGGLSVLYSDIERIGARRFDLLFLDKPDLEIFEGVICTIAVARDCCTSLNLGRKGG